MGRALSAIGEDRWAQFVRRRTGDKLNNQMREFRDLVMHQRSPLVHFSQTPGISPAEHGIWYWGLREIQAEIDSDDVVTDWPEEFRAELAYMIKVVTRYCFDSFQYWDIPGDRHWSVPYWNNLPADIGPGPSSGNHFAWLAAVNAEVVTADDVKKLGYIKRLGAGIEARFKG